MEFIGRLVALVPRPRTNLTRFHGVFSRGGHPPNSRLRKQIVPEQPARDESECKPKGYGMSWAKRLKRVFGIEIEKCDKCGGNVKILASIEDPAVVEKILKHLGLDRDAEPHNRSPPTHSSGLFDQVTTLI